MAIDLNTNTQSARVAKQTRQKRVKPTPAKATLPVVSVTQTNLGGGPLDAEARQGMISEAAYYRAAQRSFEPGHELDDWLAAERDIDACLCGETHPF